MSNVKLQGNVSGTGSVTITSPNTNSDRTITLPDSSGTFVVDGASQSPTFNAVTTTTLSVAGNNISAVNGNWRNRIINGAMVIDQRNAGASVNLNNAGAYTVDRWQCFGSGGATTRATVQQNAGSVTPPAGFTNYLGVTSSGAYSIPAGEYHVVYQKIEGFNAADLAWGSASAQTVTLSFWVRSSLTGTFGGSIQNSAQNRNYNFSFSIAAANTWEYKTVVIPGDTTGTWLTNNGIGVQVFFSVGSGSTAVGAAGSWGGTALFGVTGQVNLVATNGATFYITGVQLEAGSVASPFERRDYGRELIMCQRYYEYGGGVTMAATFSTVYPQFWYKVTKRATPTVTNTRSVTVSNGAEPLSLWYQNSADSANNAFTWTASAEL